MVKKRVGEIKSNMYICVYMHDVSITNMFIQKEFFDLSFLTKPPQIETTVIFFVKRNLIAHAYLVCAGLFRKDFVNKILDKKFKMIGNEWVNNDLTKFINYVLVVL